MPSSAVTQNRIESEVIPEFPVASELSFSFERPVGSASALRNLLTLLSDSGLLGMSTIAACFLSNSGRVEWALIVAAVLIITKLSSGWEMWPFTTRRVPTYLDDKRRILIVGSGRIGRALAAYFEEVRVAGCQFIGFLDEKHSSGPDIMGEPENLIRVAQKHFIDEVFLTTPPESELTGKLWSDARVAQVNMSLVERPRTPERGTSPSLSATTYRVAVLHRRRERILAPIVKREMDFLLAIILLAVLSPLLLAVAIAVRLDSPGSVLYLCRRMGKRGRLFTCYKFRTMVSDAHAMRERLTHLNECERILFKIKSDPRITRLGRFLRKYSLDELPQLWNVLLGDMSLVGPRPPLPEEYEKYSIECYQRLRVRPGITGLWQVTARQNPSFDVYMSLDLQYVQNWSLWWDLKILLQTIPAVFHGTGW